MLLQFVQFVEFAQMVWSSTVKILSNMTYFLLMFFVYPYFNHLAFPKPLMFSTQYS